MENTATLQSRSGSRVKFLVGGLLIIAAVIYLIATSMQASAQYFLTIDEMLSKGDSVIGQNLRVSGAVIGDSIQYDAQNLILTFEVRSEEHTSELQSRPHLVC